MLDDEFPNTIMMQILRTKIDLHFHRTEETDFCLVHEYLSTLNRKNEAMGGTDKIDCEPTDNVVVNDHMRLGEEHILQLDNGDSNIDWSLGYDISHNYSWVAEIQY